MNPDAARRFVQSKLTLYRKRMDLQALKSLILQVQGMGSSEEAEALVMNIILRSSEPKITTEMYQGLMGALNSSNAEIFAASVIQPFDSTNPFFHLRKRQFVWVAKTLEHTADTVLMSIKLRLALMKKFLSQYIYTIPSINTGERPLDFLIKSCNYLQSLALLEGSTALQIMAVGIFREMTDFTYLEDETATIRLSIKKVYYRKLADIDLTAMEEYSQISLPLYDQAIVVVIGKMVSGTLQADIVFTPQFQNTNHFNSLMNAEKLPTSTKIYTALGTKTPEFGLILSHVLLSNKACMQDLLGMLADYNENTDTRHIPSHVILCGSFCNNQSNSEVMRIVRRFLDELINRELANVYKHTVFVFIPNEDDPSITGNVYPRRFSSEMVVKELGERYSDIKVCFPTTPFRLIYGHQVFVISSMPHKRIFTQTIKTSEVMAGLKTYTATYEELARLIVAQMNIFPFPLNAVPRMWGLEPLLNLVPMPNAILLCDSATAQTTTVGEVTFVSPGNFQVDRTYGVFYAAKADCPVSILQLSRQQDE